MGRFVGYLEETAVDTYSDLVTKVETPGTKLHEAWGHLKAPDVAINYWRMEKEALWVDVLKQIMTDEGNHRDVNHTFAGLNANTKNPYLQKHHNNMQQVVEFMKASDAWQYEKGVLREDKKLNHTKPMDATKEECIAVYDTLPKSYTSTEKVSPYVMTGHLTDQHIEFSDNFLRLMMDHCDENENGHISREEWTNFIEKIYKTN